jgi:hypothetical protein
VPHLKRYFVMTKAAFVHWPEDHDTQFNNHDECRKWLQMKAGHYVITGRIPLKGLSKEDALFLAEAVIRASGEWSVPRVYKSEIIVYAPKSISFPKLAHLDACQLFNDVSDVIAAETGMDPEQLMNETEKAA